MMPIERMRPEDFDAVFRLLARSFPAGERRDKAGQRALLADSAYQIDILRAPSGGVQALMASWDFGGFVFFEHFAVDPACRNGGTLYNVGEPELQNVFRNKEKETKEK